MNLVAYHLTYKVYRPNCQCFAAVVIFSTYITIDLSRWFIYFILSRDENGSDTDGYHRCYICFHISVRIRIWIRIVSTMPDRIWLDIDIIDMRFEYSDTDMVSDIEYPDSDTDKSEPSKRIRSRIQSENIRTASLPDLIISLSLPSPSYLSFTASGGCCPRRASSACLKNPLKPWPSTASPPCPTSWWRASLQTGTSTTHLSCSLRPPLGTLTWPWG